MIRKHTRATTTDRGPPDGSAPIHTVEQLGPNMSKLPNGSLLCRNVPIARSGWLLYGAGEVPVQPNAFGLAYVERTHDALFNDITMGSFNAAAVTDDHPPEDVTPENWDKYAVGYCLNTRQGTGDNADVVLADLVITKRSTIDAILAGKREVSAGYDADYETRGPGNGLQFNIVGNHIALVQRGRCGPRCAIGDEEFNPNQQESVMAQQGRTRVQLNGIPGGSAVTAVRQRVADAEAALAAAKAEEQELGAGADEDGIHVHLHMGDQTSAEGAPTRSGVGDTEARLGALEGGQEAILATLAEIKAAVLTKDGAPPPTNTGGEDDEGDDAAKAAAAAATAAAQASAAAATTAATTDSAALQTGYMAMLAQAEILVPGFKVPTFDAAAKRATTVDRMCATRRSVLNAVLTTDAGKALLSGIEGSPVTADSIIAMDCVAAATLFKAAAGAQAVLNNGSATRDAARLPTPLGPTGAAKVPMPSAEEMNRINAEFWAGTLQK